MFDNKSINFAKRNARGGMPRRPFGIVSLPDVGKIESVFHALPHTDPLSSGEAQTVMALAAHDPPIKATDMVGE